LYTHSLFNYPLNEIIASADVWHREGDGSAEGVAKEPALPVDVRTHPGEAAHIQCQRKVQHVHICILHEVSHNERTTKLQMF